MKRAGFTMIELIFVIVILGILAAVAVPKLAATRDDAKQTTLLSDYKSALKTLQSQMMSAGSKPTVTDYFSATGNFAEVNASGLAIGTSTTTECAKLDLNTTHITITIDSTKTGCGRFTNEQSKAINVLGTNVSY